VACIGGGLGYNVGRRVFIIYMGSMMRIIIVIVVVLVQLVGLGLSQVWAGAPASKLCSV
jgi:hypothetical protein